MKRANERRPAGIGQRPQQPREDLSRRPVHERVEVGRQRTAEDLRGDVDLGRAAGVREQAGVVGLGCCPSVDAEPVGEAHRDHRRLQPVLERKCHPQICRQAERGDQLGGADSLVAVRLGCHAATLSLAPRRR